MRCQEDSDNMMRNPESRTTTRALVVDDEENLLELIGEMLRYCGCEADLARGGREALQLALARTEDYDLILVDYVLPGFGGPAFYRALAARDPRQAKRVVFMTGGDPAASPLREFFEETQRPALRKPFGVERLERLVKTTIHAA
jgi:CheY-like chemotaxis protein